jgi:hypothetical protein
VLHDAEKERGRQRTELVNPAAWLRRAFERVVGSPRYLLRVTGFGKATVDGTAAVTVVWGSAHRAGDDRCVRRRPARVLDS